MINTCYPTHHLQFGLRRQQYAVGERGWSASGAAGWLNVKMFEETATK